MTHLQLRLFLSFERDQFAQLQEYPTSLLSSIFNFLMESAVEKVRLSIRRTLSV